MSAAKAETAPATTGEKHHLTFFRQSGWFMFANFAGGILMFAVHSIAQKMDLKVNGISTTAEYGVFTTLIQVVTLMGVPAIGMQSLFTQQAASVMNADDERRLAGTLRGVLRGTFFLWIALAVITFIFQQQISARMGIKNPAALWVTVVIGLAAMWKPALQGTMQGRQNFLWLGGIMITDGVVRLGAVAVVVLLLSYQAAGSMFAVMLAWFAVVGVGVWQCWDCFRGPTLPTDWKLWSQKVVPLTFGMGVGIFMLSADMIFVQAFFDKTQTGYYAAAGMIGRALVYFTAPIASVMFPKLARSSATGEKSNALALALGLTGLAGMGAAIFCTVFPDLPLKLVKYGPAYFKISAPLIPWFGWCMLPLTLATVLLNGLMAQSKFKCVPWVVAIATGYGVTLYLRHEKFEQVIQTLGIFSTLLCATCAWFTFGPGRKTA